MIYIIGLGLGNWKSMPLIGYEILKKVNKIFIETYTSPIDLTNIEKTIKKLNKKLLYLTREDIENTRFIRYFDKNEEVALLIPGDPLIATTHQYLVKELTSLGYQIKIIHSSSILSAAIGESGLHTYKFGPIATITRPASAPPDRAITVLVDNLSRGLHTLLLLEYDQADGYSMSPYEAMEILDNFRKKKRILQIKDDQIVISISGLGYGYEEKIWFRWYNYHKITNIKGPAVLIIPGSLHYTEKEYIEEVLKKIE